MKHMLFGAALLAATTLPALPDQPGGVAGRVTNLATGSAYPHAAVAIFRLPLHTTDRAVRTETTDGNGNFADITLEPGRYLVTADVAGLNASCVIDDVFGGQTTRIKIEVGGDGQRCIGPRVHSATINPANTADEYIIPG